MQHRHHALRRAGGESEAGAAGEVFKEVGLDAAAAGQHVFDAGGEEGIAQPSGALAGRAVHEDIRRVLAEGVAGGVVDALQPRVGKGLLQRLLAAGLLQQIQPVDAQAALRDDQLQIFEREGLKGQQAVVSGGQREFHRVHGIKAQGIHVAVREHFVEGDVDLGLALCGGVQTDLTGAVGVECEEARGSGLQRAFGGRAGVGTGEGVDLPVQEAFEMLKAVGMTGSEIIHIVHGGQTAAQQGFVKCLCAHGEIREGFGRIQNHVGERLYAAGQIDGVGLNLQRQKSALGAGEIVDLGEQALAGVFVRETQPRRICAAGDFVAAGGDERVSVFVQDFQIQERRVEGVLEAAGGVAGDQHAQPGFALHAPLVHAEMTVACAGGAVGGAFIVEKQLIGGGCGHAHGFASGGKIDPEFKVQVDFVREALCPHGTGCSEHGHASFVGAVMTLL